MIWNSLSFSDFGVHQQVGIKKGDTVATNGEAREMQFENWLPKANSLESDLWKLDAKQFRIIAATGEQLVPSMDSNAQ